MPEERAKRDSVSPLQRKLAKWTGIIASVGTALAGVVLLSVQTCGEIRAATTKAKASEVKVNASYETLQPIVEDLVRVADETTEWSDGVNADLDELQGLYEEIDELKLQLVRHDAYFDMLKENNSNLRNTSRPAEAVAAVAAVQASKPEPAPDRYSKPKASKMKLDAPPKDLKDAVQQQLFK